jgi:hypothetical protein
LKKKPDKGSSLVCFKMVLAEKRKEYDMCNILEGVLRVKLGEHLMGSFCEKNIDGIFLSVSRK